MHEVSCSTEELNNGEGWVYQIEDRDGYGRKTRDRTLIPTPDPAATNGRYRFITEYTHRDDGQVSPIRYPTGTNTSEITTSNTPTTIVRAAR